ncbi:hypothetical protein ACWF9G_22300 [Nocardia sp. NPDC055029]
MESLALSGLAWVWMWAGVGQLVSVGWSAAEIASFDPGLCGHGGADADFDAVAFTFGHAAEDGHDQAVCFGVRVDRSADFGHPEFDAVVDEYGEDESELVAVEGALGSPMTTASNPRSGSRSSSRSLLASGRRFQGMDRDWPMSKNSATIRP